MATRGIIGRTTPSGFIARHHHWDSNPRCLGKTLYNAYQRVFNKDIVKMMHFLIDGHPAGWSTIVGKDLSLKPGFSDIDERRIEGYQESEKARRAECYCHGDRHESEQTIRSFTDAWVSWAEYAYIINEASHLMIIYARSAGEWIMIAKVELNGYEPDWKALNHRGQ